LTFKLDYVEIGTVIADLMAIAIKNLWDYMGKGIGMVDIMTARYF